MVIFLIKGSFSVFIQNVMLICFFLFGAHIFSFKYHKLAWVNTKNHKKAHRPNENLKLNCKLSFGYITIDLDFSIRY